MKAWWWVFSFATLATGCASKLDDLFCTAAGCEWTPGAWELVAGLAGPPAPPPDPSNRYADQPAAAALGQLLFFDDAFSGPSQQVDTLFRPTTVGRSPRNQPSGVSCASCHELTRGGADVTSVPGNVSIGAGMMDVNAPSVLNASLHEVLFWNGRLESLWGVNLVLAENELILNGNRLQTAHVLADRYASEAEAAFGAGLPDKWKERIKALPPQGKPGGVPGCQLGAASEPAGDAYDCLPAADQQLATDVLVLWAKALAAYERKLGSRGSAFDQFVAEGPASTRISEAARRGARLFVGKGGCTNCHSGALLGDDEFENVAVPQAGPGVPTVSECVAAPCDCVTGTSCLPYGAYNGQVWRADPKNPWPGVIDDHDDGKTTMAPAAAMKDAEPPPAAPEPRLRGFWRTPSLRDVALTAPYMHDGAYRTLEEVIWHYNTAGRAEVATAVGTPGVVIKPLGLTTDETGDLVAFLKTLTGEPLPAQLLAHRANR